MLTEPKPRDLSTQESQYYPCCILMLLSRYPDMTTFAVNLDGTNEFLSLHRGIGKVIDAIFGAIDIPICSPSAVCYKFILSSIICSKITNQAEFLAPTTGIKTAYEGYIFCWKLVIKTIKKLYLYFCCQYNFVVHMLFLLIIIYFFRLTPNSQSYL